MGAHPLDALSSLDMFLQQIESYPVFPYTTFLHFLQMVSHKTMYLIRQLENVRYNQIIYLLQLLLHYIHLGDPPAS